MPLNKETKSSQTEIHNITNEHHDKKKKKKKKKTKEIQAV